MRITKESYIRQYIDEFHPTYKQLQFYCNQVNTRWPYKGQSSLLQELSAIHTHSELRLSRGYYSTNIRKWRSNGNIFTKGNRYYLSPEFKEANVGLYALPPSLELKRNRRRLLQYNLRISELSRENYELRITLREINKLTKR